MGWYPEIVGQDNKWPAGDFDVNTLVLNNKGIHIKETKHDLSLFSILENIENREAQSLINLERIQNEIFNMYDRNLKIGNFKQLSFFIGNRLKILSYGYKNILGYVPVTCIENEQECPITYLPAPYMTVTLECGHAFSSMALMSSVHRISAASFNFKCYLCRNPFRLRLVQKSSIKKPSLKIGDNISMSSAIKKGLLLNKLNNQETETSNTLNLLCADYEQDRGPEYDHQRINSNNTNYIPQLFYNNITPIRQGRFRNARGSYNDESDESD
jgi:hypothetical protein